MFTSQSKKSSISNNTLERRESLLNKAVNSNKTFPELKNLNRIEWNKALGTKVRNNDSLKAQKRLLVQIEKDSNRIIEKHVKKRYGANKNIQNSARKEANRIIHKPKKVSGKTIESRLEKLKVGSYTITKVLTERDGFKYITAHNSKEFKKQLKRLQLFYGKTTLISTGNVHIKKPFETPQMRARRKQLGISFK